MKIQSGLTLALVLFALVSCDQDSSSSDDAKENNGPDVVQQEPAKEEAPVNIQTAPAAASTAALNPPHGEPGHDCAIPVGAPLDGSGGTAQPAANVQPAAQPFTQPATQPASTSTLPAGTPNPAHGEPGHDCAVAVGAPLPG